MNGSYGVTTSLLMCSVCAVSLTNVINVYVMCA